MHEGGELVVHDNVTFEANTAERGGAVSLRSNSVAHVAHPAGVVRFDRICDEWFESRC